MEPGATDLLAVSKNVSRNELVLGQRSAEIITQKVFETIFYNWRLSDCSYTCYKDRTSLLSGGGLENKEGDKDGC